MRDMVARYLYRKTVRRDGIKLLADKCDTVLDACNCALEPFVSMGKITVDEAAETVANIIGLLEPTDGGPVVSATHVKSYKEGFEAAKPKWRPVEGFNQVGWCWIIHKGKVVESYCDGLGSFRHYNGSTSVYMTECISEVMTWDVPAPAWADGPGI